MVDANGGFDPRAALAAADGYCEHQVEWFEEPVSSRDRDGLRFIRERLPAGMALAAGEYTREPDDAAELLRDGAVDVLQADVTRCGEIAGALRDDAQRWRTWRA
jgi:L-rhamnonate dehydratase